MAAVATPNVFSGSRNEYRVCPVTTLKVDAAAERLIIWNAVTAIVALTLGGTYALLIGLTRWPDVHLLSAPWFYRLLTAHGMNMLVFWMVFFEAAGLYFGACILLNARLVGVKLAWVAYALMLVGAVMVNYIILAGEADVMFSAYPPLEASPLFYIGYILFAVGAILVCCIFIATILVAKKERRYEGSMPLAVFGLLTAAIIALFTLASGAIALIPTLLWRLGIIPAMDPGFYRVTFWGFGHSAQQVNLSAMIAIWYSIATLTVGAKPVNEKLSRFAFVFYILFINLGSMHHLLVDPGLASVTKFFNTSYAMYLAVLGSLIHAYSIPAAIESAMRAKGYNKGLFGWLLNAPWKEPGFVSLILSMAIFGFIGGPTGVVLGAGQLNLLAHNTWRITGHFHATVVGGTTLAFMGFTYYVIPLVFRRPLFAKPIVIWQPWVYGIGVATMSIAMTLAGTFGAPRRHWDVTFTNAIIPVQLPSLMNLFLTLAGIGTLLAVTGGIMYVVICVGSLFMPKREARSLSPLEA
ncbi:MAG: cbb3-type cytochrome c oxidase subunit I [Chloroflexi bacterium]|nr:cbb3-type cytochrome c oxidase subunit I [Chloroflexota bacterium]MBI5054441.1 cbb3-type cytochrome c oxidase subunit I [Chloroflexota bacterium]MBI5082642.1 cbb3-type cytochrome c oxidase subunit I [Chloroflexota bacterium]MBI5349585.1 cbb3-type cytochrome c oxidase subunit I [Chloroflexota bacterium]MBI5715284.1 cbb3-type cytochrome c oxidase subunit I [Chloroflexota bacterium]